MLLRVLLILLLVLLLIAIPLVVLLSHTQRNLLHTLASNSNASRSIAFLVGDGEDEVALVGVRVPGLDPGGLVLGSADGADGGVDVAGCDLGWDHVALVAGLGVVAPATVAADYLELGTTLLVIRGAG